jgi:hypothetical protein
MSGEPRAERGPGGEEIRCRTSTCSKRSTTPSASRCGAILYDVIRILKAPELLMLDLA